jgi:hypothetical protein
MRKPLVLWCGLLVCLSSGYGDVRISEEAAANIRLTGYEKQAVIEHLRGLKIAEESKNRLVEFIAFGLTADYIPPGLPLERGNYEALCAGAVSRLFWFIFGGEDDWNSARGVSGDAWNMARNVLFFGGQSFVWNPWISPRTGDILGMFYTYSIYNPLRKNRDYTHVALVVANLPERGPLLAHWWGIPERFLPDPGAETPRFFRLEFLSDLLEDFPGFFSPRELIRPSRVFLEYP